MPILDFLLESPYHLVAVVTTPDRPRGRGLQVQPNPVKQCCHEKGVPVVSPESLRLPESASGIQELKPDIFVVASYGKLIPESWLKIPFKVSFNVHPSLLPKYRGAAPMTWQILDGEKEVGVSIAEVTKDLDAGDIFEQIRIPMGDRDTTESLTRKLSELGCKALGDALKKLETGKLERKPQDGSKSTYARKLTKEDGNLNLSEPAERLDWKVRAFDPWPGAFIHYKGLPLRIIEAQSDSSEAENQPGTLLGIGAEGSLRILTGRGTLKILKVQLPGKRVISGREFANGERLKPGFIF